VKTVSGMGGDWVPFARWRPARLCVTVGNVLNGWMSRMMTMALLFLRSGSGHGGRGRVGQEGMRRQGKETSVAANENGH
jgi:hypothetical protein